MLIWQEKEKTDEQALNEMAILRASSERDKLPFRVTIQSPETNHQPHAHIRDLKTGKKKLGEFAIAKNPPRRPEDVQEFGKGVAKDGSVPDNWKELIVEWASKPSEKFPGTNWETLWGLWLTNVDT
jgi:hypothetical protein